MGRYTEADAAVRAARQEGDDATLFLRRLDAIVAGADSHPFDKALAHWTAEALDVYGADDDDSPEARRFWGQVETRAIMGYTTARRVAREKEKEMKRWRTIILTQWGKTRRRDQT